MGPIATGRYHVLEGRGSMVVDDERFVLAAGATVIAPRGSRRGIEAETRLAFLAVRVGPDLDEAGRAASGEARVGGPL
jgi:mannose-6-phosphate isomerase-like protein (cupin superfamily)